MCIIHFGISLLSIVADGNDEREGCAFVRSAPSAIRSTESTRYTRSDHFGAYRNPLFLCLQRWTWHCPFPSQLYQHTDQSTNRGLKQRRYPIQSFTSTTSLLVATPVGGRPCTMTKPSGTGGKKKNQLTLAQLAAYDDILTDALVDHVSTFSSQCCGRTFWRLDIRIDR